MEILKIVLIILVIVSSMANVAMIGEPREPLKATVVNIGLIINAMLIIALLN